MYINIKLGEVYVCERDLKRRETGKGEYNMPNRQSSEKRLYQDEIDEKSIKV